MVTRQETLTKQEIESLKATNPEALYVLLREQKGNGLVAHILDNLGRLPRNFDGKVFIPFLNSNNDSLRYLAVKNIGKTSNDEYLESLANAYSKEQNSKIRRETVSSIGRMRSKKSIPVLLKVLADNDPKVVLQAIRALLVFKDVPEVKNVLLPLRDHPNETVQYVIRKEFSSRLSDRCNSFKHTESPSIMKNVIVHGDVREILKVVPDDSIHLTFTSPPYYNARDYSIYQSYQEYLRFLEEVFKEVYRITKEGRFFLLNTSPVIVPRFSRQHASKRYPIPFDIHPFLIKMGWEFVDDIVWEKPEASSKNRNAGFLQHRKPLGYKPNPVTEYVMVYRKKSDRLIDWAMKQYDNNIMNQSKVLGDYETSNIWKIDPKYDKHHSAVFPIALCDRVVKYYSYVGDLIFDPFAGSGTLGRSAINLNRYCFLTESEESYIEVMNQELVSKSLLVNPRPRIYKLEEFRSLSKGE